MLCWMLFPWFMVAWARAIDPIFTIFILNNIRLGLDSLDSMHTCRINLARDLIANFKATTARSLRRFIDSPQFPHVVFYRNLVTAYIGNGPFPRRIVGQAETCHNENRSCSNDKNKNLVTSSESARKKVVAPQIQE